MKYKFLLFLSVLLLAGCVEKKSPHVVSLRTATAKITNNLSLPHIPMYLTTEKDKNEFLSAHYWDCVDTSDTLAFADREQFERFFVNYIYLLSSQTPAVATQHIAMLMDSINNNRPWVLKLLQTAEFYLFDVTSPLLNEPLYIPFVNGALKSDQLNDTERIIYEDQLEVASKNNPGTLSADFSYIDPRGKSKSFHQQIKGLTLLLFSDPECEHCQEVTHYFEKSDLLLQMLSANQIQLFVIYTEGDAEVWKRWKNRYPSNWLLGFDALEKIRMERKYELRAMPSLYLLDEKCRVILKDKTPEATLEYLHQCCR